MFDNNGFSRYVLRKNVFILFIIVAIIFIVSCKTTEQVKDNNNSSTIVSAEKQAKDAGIELQVKTSDNSFFRTIDKSVISDIEFGSPASLRRAAQSIIRLGPNYTEVQKVVLSLTAQMSKIAWPSVSVNWDSPDVSIANAYLGAMDSVRQTVYDYSTGNSDFLTLILPSFLLLTSTTRTDYYKDSSDALQKAMTMNNKSLILNYLYGILLFKQGNYQKSIEYLKKSVEMETDCMETKYQLINCYTAAGQKNAAYTAAQELLLTNSENLNVLKACAKTAYSVGKYDEAESFAVRVLQQQPENAEFILFRARVLLKIHEYLKAASLLDVYAHNYDESNRDYLLLRSEIQTDWNKNLSAAITTITTALSLYPDDSEIILSAANLALKANAMVNNKTAGQLADLILAKEPNNSEALNISVSQLIIDKKWNDAYISSSKLLSLATPSVETVAHHVTICLSLNKINEAWNWAAQLYEEYPKNETIIQSYLEVLSAQNKKTQALDVINKLLPAASGKMKSFLYYRRSFLISDREGRLSELRSSLISNPRNSDTLYELYKIYYKERDYRKAQYYLKQVVALNPDNKSFIEKLNTLDSLITK